MFSIPPHLWIVVHLVLWVYKIVPLCVLSRWLHQITNFGVEHLSKHALGESCEGGAIRAEDDAFDVDADVELRIGHDDNNEEEEPDNSG